jgi:uncharacterized membrane protein YagU involved in acid resistance
MQMTRENVEAVAWSGIAGWLLIDLYLVVTHGLIFHDANALQISQWDASNALGPAAFNGGVPAALLGLVMHFCVSLIWAAIFVAVALRVPALLSHPLISGTIFGLVIFAVMIYGIVPLGHAVQVATTSPKLFNSVLAHIVAFGIPVALIVSYRLRLRKHSG